MREITSTYRSWSNMKSRCNNPNCDQYDRYGGRGIGICERWVSFDNFLEDMGERKTGLTLERKDNDGDYSAENCVWDSRKAQANNRNTNHFITAFRKTMTLAQWARETGIDRSAILRRLASGWGAERALSTKSNGPGNCWKFDEETIDSVVSKKGEMSSRVAAGLYGMSKSYVKLLWRQAKNGDK